MLVTLIGLPIGLPASKSGSVCAAVCDALDDPLGKAMDGGGGEDADDASRPNADGACARNKVVAITTARCTEDVIRGAPTLFLHRKYASEALDLR